MIKVIQNTTAEEVFKEAQLHRSSTSHPDRNSNSRISSTTLKKPFERFWHKGLRQVIWTFNKESLLQFIHVEALYKSSMSAVVDFIMIYIYVITIMRRSACFYTFVYSYVNMAHLLLYVWFDEQLCLVWCPIPLTELLERRSSHCALQYHIKISKCKISSKCYSLILV